MNSATRNKRFKILSNSRAPLEETWTAERRRFADARHSSAARLDD